MGQLKHIIPVLLAVVAFAKPLHAQQDCFDAVYVCSSSYAQNTAYSGVGAEQEVPPATTCLGNGEVNSVWYRFTVYGSGSLTFQLNPLNPNDDYDFALYNLSGDSCESIVNGSLQPVSCNYSSNVGTTGLSNGGNGNSNGSSGPNQNAALNVTAGQSYALLVSNFTASQNGYTLSFGGSASVIDNAFATPDSVSLGGVCNPRQITLFFSEEFDCASVSGASEITVTGPSAVNVTQVTGMGCNDGVTDALRIRFQNKISAVGTYTITINTGSDGNTLTDGCGNQTAPGTVYTFTVDFIGPNVNVVNVVHTNCGLDEGSAEAVVTNGTPPYSYNWNSSPTQNTPIATDLGPGTYRIRVTDANGCQERVNVTIQNDSPFDLTNTSVTDVSCFGLADGSAQLIPTGGQGPYVITWSSSPPQVGQNATGLPAGLVTATVMDATGCFEDVNLTISQPPAIEIDVTSVAPSCGFADGELNAVVTGGNGALNYAWDTSPVQSTTSAVALPAGIYTLTVTDQSGCGNTSTTILNNGISLNLNVTDRVPDCGQGVGSITVTPTAGTPPYTYSWNSAPPQFNATATGLSYGEYFVSVEDANNCVQIVNVKVDSVPPPTLTYTLTQPSCGGSDGEALATVSNGTAPFDFTWSSSANTTDTETGLAEGTYTVTVTDSIGCIDTETFTLNQLPPTSSFTWNDACIGYETFFDVETNSGATVFHWIFGDGAASDQENPTYLYGAVGTYEVSIILEGGCMNDTVTNTVNVYSPPTVDFAIDPQILTTRTNAEFTYTGSSASVFEWDFGDGTSSTGSVTEHRYGEDGFYTVELVASDENGCIDSTSQIVEVLIQPVIYMPNAFAPNGTPDNSRFKGYGIGVVTAELSIFDRWGTMLFYSDDLNEILNIGWDGNYKGEAAPQGVYPYKLKASFYTNTEFERLGTITLIR